MRILNISTPVLDGYHSYFGGASGHIIYCMFKALSRYVTLHTLLLDSNAELPFTYTKVSHSVNSLFFLKYKRLISKLIAKYHPDVITHFYFHETEFNPVVTNLTSNFIIGMVELPHIRLPDELTTIDRIKKLMRPIALRLTDETIKKASKIVVVNEGAKQYYSKYTDEIEVIPYGVDHQLFKYVPLPENKNVVVVSRLIKRRGVHYIIQALSGVIKYHKDVVLHIVGSGSMKSTLEHLACKNNLAVVFHNNVTINKLKQIFANSYVFCHFSMSDGWNQPALEAMSVGRPVICTNAPFNSMVKHEKTGFLVDFPDVKTLADYFIYLFDDQDEARRMGKNSRKEVLKNYDWDKIAKQYVGVFEEVIR